VNLGPMLGIVRVLAWAGVATIALCVIAAVLR
jgi:hypothetical protein